MALAIDMDGHGFNNNCITRMLAKTYKLGNEVLASTGGISSKMKCFSYKGDCIGLYVCSKALQRNQLHNITFSLKLYFC